MTFSFNNFYNPCGLGGNLGLGGCGNMYGFNSFMPGGKVTVKTTGGTGSIFSPEGRSPQVTTVTYEEDGNWFTNLIKGFTFARGGIFGGFGGFGNYASPYGMLNSYNSGLYDPAAYQTFGLGQYNLGGTQGYTEADETDKTVATEKTNLTSLAGSDFKLIVEPDGSYTLHNPKTGKKFEGDYETVRKEILAFRETQPQVEEETKTETKQNQTQS